MQIRSTFQAECLGSALFLLCGCPEHADRSQSGSQDRHKQSFHFGSFFSDMVRRYPEPESFRCFPLPAPAGRMKRRISSALVHKKYPGTAGKLLILSTILRGIRYAGKGTACRLREADQPAAGSFLLLKIGRNMACFPLHFETFRMGNENKASRMPFPGGGIVFLRPAGPGKDGTAEREIVTGLQFQSRFGRILQKGAIFQTKAGIYGCREAPSKISSMKDFRWNPYEKQAS